MNARLSLTAVYEPVEDGWVQARIEELPAVITVAPSLEEAKALLVDALHEYLLPLGGTPQPGDETGGKVERLPLQIFISAA